MDKGYWFYLWCVWIGWGWLSLYETRKNTSQIEIYVLILATLFPVFAVRYISLSAMLSFPHITERSYRLYPSGFNPRIASIIIIPITALIFIFGYPVSLDNTNPPGSGFDFGIMPTDIIQHIKANRFKGVIMNHYHDGAFFINSTYPEVLPIIDSRTDFMGKDLIEEHYKVYSSKELFNQFVNKYQISMVVMRLMPETQDFRNYLLSSPDWTLEKMGLDNALFVKTSKVFPKVSHEQISESITRSPIVSVQSESSPEMKTSYCGFIRFFGHCALAPECHSICQLTDPELAKEMRLSRPYCLKFSQACFNPQTACGGCQDFCQQYNRVVQQINQLGFHYPRTGNCER